MLICSKKNGIYEGVINVQNNEIESKDVTEMIKMGITLMKIDIMISEIRTVRAEVKDYAQMYKILEDETNGNIMRAGEIWRGKAMKTVEHTFMSVMQASKIVNEYEMHEKMLTNFVRMNQKNEGQEFMSLGWVESSDKQIEIKMKMTRRDCEHIQQRIEICQTKVQILRKCNENETIGTNLDLLMNSTLTKRGWES